MSNQPLPTWPELETQAAALGLEIVRALEDAYLRTREHQRFVVGVSIGTFVPEWIPGASAADLIVRRGIAAFLRVLNGGETP